MKLDEDTRLGEALLCLLKTSEASLTEFKSKIENKNVFIFVGNTRSGKSTLVSYLLGDELIAFKEDNAYKIKHKYDENVVSNIGQGPLSYTTIPVVYEMTDQTNSVIVDAPGFDDNKGVIQDIINALYINQVKYAKALRFIVVCDINTILKDNITEFSDLISTLHLMVPDTEKLQESISIIFTKDRTNHTREDIIKILRDKVLDVGLNLKKELVKTIVEQEELIGMFKMPLQEGSLTEDINMYIEESVFKSKPLQTDLYDLKFGISFKAQLALLNTYMQYFDVVSFASGCFKEVESYISKQLKVCLQKENLWKLKDNQLQDVQKVLKSVSVTFKMFLNTSTLCKLPELIYIDLLKEVEKVLNLMNTFGVTSILKIDDEVLRNLKDEMPKKFEYLQCIEGIIGKCDKSNNILSKFKSLMSYLIKDVADLSSIIQNEQESRKCFEFVVKNVVDILPNIQSLSDSYLFASSEKELYRMKNMLQNHEREVKNACEEISKRPELYERVSSLVNHACEILSSFDDKLTCIKEEIRMRTWEMVVPHIPPQVMHCVAPYLLYYSCSYVLNKQWNWENAAYHSLEALCISLVGSSKYIRNFLWRIYGRCCSRMYKRVSQKRLFRNTTVLDSYFQKTEKKLKFHMGEI